MIFFLGDGMSIPTLAAARTYLGQLQGNPGEETELTFEQFPYVGLSKVRFMMHIICFFLLSFEFKCKLPRIIDAQIIFLLSDLLRILLHLTTNLFRV